jgi:pimeloyl-ACP methyl ester carboxylesterase
VGIDVQPIHVLDIGTGPPLVLIHGDFNDGLGAWSRQIASLTDKHRLMVIDRRGHGASPKEPRPYTIQDDASDILTAIDRSGHERFHLAGHSYGGLVAIEIARQAPERVMTLQLIEPPYLDLLADDPAILQLIERGLEIQRRAREWGVEQTAFEFFTMLAGPVAAEKMRGSANWPSVVREAGRIIDAEYPSQYPASALADLRYNGPIKIYTGGRSHPGLRAVAHRLAELLPSSTLVDIPNGTHAVQLVGEPFDNELLALTLAHG